MQTGSLNKIKGCPNLRGALHDPAGFAFLHGSVSDLPVRILSFRSVQGEESLQFQADLRHPQPKQWAVKARILDSLSVK